MKIIADKNIPFLQGVAEQYGEVEYIAGNAFTKESIKNADTLIVRTVTHFGAEILDGSNVKLICTATIGFDHIDTQYCDDNGIIWKNAPGCNSGSVMQYIVSSLIIIAGMKNFSLKDKTIGIVGVGNVGKKVARACQLLGMRVLLNDPPRQKDEQSDKFTDLETIKKEADIITFHTPFTKSGEHKTHHLADDNFFNTLGKKPIIINSARGGIVETRAIKQAIVNNKISGSIIDCWENEPEIDGEYMSMTDIATPHIAGYSADGKANATRMSLESIANYWKLSKEPIKHICAPAPENSTLNIADYNHSLEEVILATYNPLTDYAKLIEAPEQFSALRSHYPLRREYEAYTIINTDNEAKELLINLGFKVR